MTRLIEIGNSANWENIYQYSATAEIDNGFPIPLKSVVLPFFIETDIISVYVNTEIPSGKRWRWGGKCEQIFNGLSLGKITSSGEQKPLWINKLQTIFFPSITAQYSLRFEIPYWFFNYYLEVYAYNGKDDTSEKVLMIEEFSNLNFKIDKIMSKLYP